MKKFETVEDLLKAGGLHSHFQKAAEHNTALAKAHGDHSAFLKAKADAMDDGDAHKAFFTKAADHHAMVAACYKAQAEHNTAMADNTDGDKEATKAAPAAPGTPAAAAAAALLTSDASLGTEVGAFMKESFQGAMSELKNDPSFKEIFKNAVMAEAQKLLSGKVVPDGVHGAIPPNPLLKLVPRPGGPSGDNEKEPEVPLEHAHMVED